MLKKALWIVVIVGLAGFAFFCMRRASALGLPDSRLAILVWAAIGAVAAAVSGCLAGRPLWRLLQRKPAAAVLLALIGIANLAVFYLLWGPPMCEDWGNPTRTETLTQAFLALAGVFLLALSSYLLGCLLIRPRVPVRRGWWVLLIFLLYGSIPVGILTGDARFAKRGMMHPQPLHLNRSIPFEVAFNQQLERFPRVGGNPPQEGPFTLYRGIWPWMGNHEIPRGEMIQASDSVAIVDGKILKLIGYGLLPAPRSTLALDSSWKPGQAFFWDPSGRPLSEALVPAVSRSERHDTDWSHDVIVVLERPPDWNFDLFAARLRYPTWDGLTIAEDFRPHTTEDRIVAQGIVRFPVFGPLEFSLEFFQGRSPEYAMPPVQGATIELPWNRLYLNVLRQHRLKSTTTGSSWHDEYKFTPRPDDDGKPVTTAIFEPAMDRMANLEIHAILKDGRRVSGSRTGHVPHVWQCEFDCALDEIAEFRISSVTHPTRVRFQLPPIPVFPQVNEGVRNLLDVRFPVLPFENREDVSTFIMAVFLYSGAQPHTDPPERLHEYWSVREFLDHYYSNRWHIRDGRIQFYPIPKTPILRKIMLAAEG